MPNQADGLDLDDGDYHREEAERAFEANKLPEGACEECRSDSHYIGRGASAQWDGKPMPLVSIDLSKKPPFKAKRIFLHRSCIIEYLHSHPDLAIQRG